MNECFVRAGCDRTQGRQHGRRRRGIKRHGMFAFSGTLHDTDSLKNISSLHVASAKVGVMSGTVPHTDGRFYRRRWELYAVANNTN